MAETLTATVDDVTHSVRLLVAGGVPPYVIDASPAGDLPDYRVRSVYSTVPGDATARAAIDGDVPLNTDTVYVATDSHGTQAVSGIVRVTSTTPVLSDATDPGKALPVVVVSQKPNAWQGRSVWWDILGSRAPFASTAPLRFRNGQLVLNVTGRAERRALLDLLTTGNPLTLRAVCPDAVDDVVALVESVDESLRDEQQPAGASLFTLTYQAVARELGPYAVDPGRTYASVLAAYPTYGDVRTTYPDYAALRAGDPGAGLGPELISNGNFASGPTDWSTFWTTGASWSTAAGTSLFTADTATPVIALQPDADPFRGTGPGRRYRVTGRVRTSHPPSNIRVEFLTNTLPDLPGYFEPGTQMQAAATPAAPGWSSFAVEFAVPTGDDVAAVFFRADGVPVGGNVEWDDLSARERTG